MKTLDRVREDLRDIRHYYSKIEDFEKISKVIGSPLALAMVESYNKKVLNAPIRLYDLYVSLYLRNNSQLVVAEDWGVSISQIALLSKQLNEFFVEEFKKEG